MIRMTLFVFTPQFSFNTLNIGNAFVWLGVAAIIMGSVLALSAVCLKKMLTYILIAEVGYMVGGLWLGNRSAVTGAILHIVNDAVMTLCVFLASGTFIYRIKGDAYENMKGLFRKMPFSMAAFTVGALSIIGVPPTCGFFSKWYLITGGIAAGHYGFVAALLFSSLVNLVLFFRIIEIAYFEPFPHHDENEKLAAAEAPAGMLIPLMVAAAGLIVLGIYTGYIVTHIIRFAIPAGIV
jgi:multicomponent Na+:H+ antiporter subunit D